MVTTSRSTVLLSCQKTELAAERPAFCATRGRAAFSFFLRKALQLLKKYSHLRKGLNITQDADK